MEKIVTLDLSRTSSGTNNKYGIIFEKGRKIVDFIIAPNDYTVSEFIELVKNHTYYDNSIPVAYDGNGIGALLKESFNNECDLSRKVCSLAEYVETGKNALFELALNSNFSETQKLEFRKLVREVENLSVTPHSGRLSYTLKDSSIGKQRAITYLLYFATFEGRCEFMTEDVNK